MTMRPEFWRTDFWYTHRKLERWTDAQAATMIRTGHHCGTCVGCPTIPKMDGKPDPETICSAYLRRRS